MNTSKWALIIIAVAGSLPCSTPPTLAGPPSSITGPSGRGVLASQSGATGSNGPVLPEVLSLRDYEQEAPRGFPTSPTKSTALDLLGIEVADGMDWFDGQHVMGVEVLKVRASSPAARAGLHSRSAAVNTLLETVTFVGALVFEPTALAFQYVEDRGIGDQHDLIIGVDGNRVEDVFQLQDATQGAKATGVFYLTILRQGRRMQIPLFLEDGGSK